MSWIRSVYSEMVAEVGWDDDLQAIIIRWKKSAKTSGYFGASEDVAEACASAPSVGQFVNTEIKPFYEHRYV